MQRYHLPCYVLAAAFAFPALAADKKEQPMTPGGKYRAHDMGRPRPQVVTPPGFSTQEKPGQPPSDAIVLFDGKDLSKWMGQPRKDSPPSDDKPQWKIENGYAEIVPKAGAIRTRDKFKGDYQLHLEWATPEVVVGNSQGRGNSGLYIGGFPEVQVLDSYQNDTYPDGQAAGIYGYYPPMVNASRKPGEWQTYDVFFERAKLGADGKPVSKARLTVIHNGIVVQYMREFDSPDQEGDILLQDHLNPVRYRNIWLRHLIIDSDAAGTPPPPKPAPPAATPKPPAQNKSAATGDAESGKLDIVRIKTLAAQMKYDISEFTVRPGQKFKIVFENGDDLPHNLVFCDPGTDTAALALKQMDDPEAALKRNWLPDDKRIWLHSKLLNPHEREVLVVTAPQKAAEYPFVCTFPGHALTMRGAMKVLPLGEGLKDLKFALYLGKWDRLPDFSKLTPHREGSVPDNLVQIKLDDYKNEFGLVFTGKLNAPRTGSYRFFAGGDDGVRLLIDGKPVVDYDGIHPADVREGSTRLTEGLHAFRLEYFQAAGEIALFAAWKGSNFDVTPLSVMVPKGWERGKPKKKQDYAPIPLIVKDEAVVYRNFIAGAGNRGIAVGFPGNLSIAWSAEQMNLELLWRGAFMDASLHWNSRGGGYQPPMGYDAASPAPGPPLAVLQSMAAPWPATEERASGYAWKGYRLDARRIPSFNYEWNGLKVTDYYSPSGNGLTPEGKIQRTMKLEGKVPPNTCLRLATGKIEAKGPGFLVHGQQLDLSGRKFENTFMVTAAGARIAGDSLILPVHSNELLVTYSWPR